MRDTRLPEFDYIKDGTELYRRSFATIRAEADLTRFPADVARVVVRMIHSCGMTDLPGDVGYSDGVVRAARGALLAGRPGRGARLPCSGFRWGSWGRRSPRTPWPSLVLSTWWCTAGAGAAP